MPRRLQAAAARAGELSRETAACRRASDRTGGFAEAGVHADVAGRAGEACFLPPAGPPNPGVSPKSLGRQPHAYQGAQGCADRAPRGVLSTRGARHPAASACDIQARAGCLPGAPTSKVREPPPPPCPRVSQPPCSPHDPADSRCPRPPGPPTSVQCRPVFSAAQANTATLSSPCPLLALPRDSPSRRTQGRARRAGRPAPQPGPCGSGPGPGPSPPWTATTADHSLACRGFALAHVTHSEGRSRQWPPGPHDAPPCPLCLGGQRGAALDPAPDLPTRHTTEHRPKCSVSNLWTLAPASPLDSKPVKAWPSPCGHRVPPAPRAVSGRVNNQRVLPKQMEEQIQTLLSDVLSFQHNYVHF